MKQSGFYVRRAETADAEGIAAITREAFIKYAELANLPTVDALDETVGAVKDDIKNKYVYAAFLDDKVVGSLRIEVNHTEKTAYLSRFGVSLDHQNLGVGKSLMNLVDVDMRSLSVKRLCLHTASKVGSLIIFYYRRGFFIESTSADKGYVRAFLVKEYEI